MIRHVVVAVVIGPAVFILVFMAAALLVAAGSSSGPVRTSALPSMLIYGLAAGYWFGWLPAILVGVLNGLIARFVRALGWQFPLVAGKGPIVFLALWAALGATGANDVALVGLGCLAAALASGTSFLVTGWWSTKQGAAR